MKANERWIIVDGRGGGRLILFWFTFLIILSSISLAQFKLPEYETVTLDNGLTVYLMEKKDVPLISFSAVFDGGVIKDGSTSGVASFTAEALRFGTTNYSKSQIDSLFNFYGSNISTYANADFSGLYTQFIKDNTEKLFPVIKEIILNPSFPESEIEKRKQRWIAELDQAKESPRSVIGSYFNKHIFGDSPYGNPVNGTKTGIGSISVEKVQEFYQTNYRPESTAIALVGDFNSTDMKKLIAEYFGGWKNQRQKLISDLKADNTPFESASAYLINKENATETTFLIGSYGTTMNNEDQTQLDVINTILGGRFTSWLNDELRVNAGLTYGARSRFAQYKLTGTFYISTFTQTKNTEAAIDLALKTYNRLFEKGIDEETLLSAKNYVKGQFPPDYETAASLSGFLAQKFIYGLDDSIINDFENEVNGLTVERANELIKNYFPKENLQFVLIGKADEIKDIVAKYGKVIEKSIEEDSY
ncbi:MAG: insulinase family protein [Ignavibacteriaceae bacterium]|nr:insulinase family protein [Ignavibacteriaceae bacterium]